MACFPMCMELRGRKVLLIGSGPQIADKMEKLRPFGAELVCGSEQMIDRDCVFVVVGDTDRETTRRISERCREKGIPVNVVDDSENSSFFFPSLVTRGDLTISVSTGGHAPGAAVYLARRIGQMLPPKTEEIITWLHTLRTTLYASHSRQEARRILHEATARAFTLGRPLTEQETESEKPRGEQK